MSNASKSVHDAVYGVFRDQMRGETSAGLAKALAMGEALLPHKKKLNSTGGLRKGDMLQALVQAARDEIASRKDPKGRKACGVQRTISRRIGA